MAMTICKHSSELFQPNTMYIAAEQQITADATQIYTTAAAVSQFGTTVALEIPHSQHAKKLINYHFIMLFIYATITDTIFLFQERKKKKIISPSSINNIKVKINY